MVNMPSSHMNVMERPDSIMDRPGQRSDSRECNEESNRREQDPLPRPVRYVAVKQVPGACPVQHCQNGGRYRQYENEDDPGSVHTDSGWTFLGRESRRSVRETKLATKTVVVDKSRYAQNALGLGF